ncbi:MAG TPA: hypothetical protein PK435_07335 [Thermoanaerobaculaceae bacterium]|nr:hypothetical protein [Thermoanaerobaculaceae bacterium]
MRRIAVLLALAALGGVVASLAWRWWTAPPRARAETLAAAAAAVPAQADGLVVIAEPDRALRWLARRPQALALLALAAPEADAALPQMRALLAALARDARGPLAVWWRGPDVAAAAPVGAAAARAIGDLAAIEGVPLRATPGAGDVTVATASAAALLDGGGGPGPRDGTPPELAALARRGARWWRVEAGRNRLELVSGVPPELLPAAGPSVVTTDDLAALAALLGSGNGLPHVPARLAIAGDDWALALPATTLSPQVQRLLSLAGDAPAGAGVRLWRGVLGDLWVAPPPDFAVASRPELLAAVAGAPPAGEAGAVRGADLATACVRVADALEGVPWLGARVATLRRAAPLAASLRLARWRITPAGGRILLEW